MDCRAFPSGFSSNSLPVASGDALLRVEKCSVNSASAPRGGDEGMGGSSWRGDVLQRGRNRNHSAGHCCENRAVFVRGRWSLGR